VDEFGADAAMAPHLLAMTATFSSSALAALSTEQSFTDNPDLVDDFFR
jgi:hypothetical protein